MKFIRHDSYCLISLPDDQEVGGGGFVTEYRSTEEIIMQYLRDGSAIDVAGEERLRVASVQYGWLTEVELLREISNSLLL
jgi:hypothetical protein